ncbi:hypothetical protein HY030_04350, partial [Candidatus Gottesmanbacteria bacterium]|nr:hypothetical protein [Candidatus Gottesmanbacteria bacterium]
GMVVLVPTIEAIGPIASDLERFGYKIVELGQDQIADGGGVKCRSLDIRWRKQFTEVT